MRQLHKFLPGNSEITIVIEVTKDILDIWSLGEGGPGDPGQIFDNLSELKPRQPSIRIKVVLVEQFIQELVGGDLHGCIVHAAEGGLFDGDAHLVCFINLFIKTLYLCSYLCYAI